MCAEASTRRWCPRGCSDRTISRTYRGFWFVLNRGLFVCRGFNSPLVSKRVQTARYPPDNLYYFPLNFGRSCFVCAQRLQLAAGVEQSITQLKAQGPSRTCNESKEKEKKVFLIVVCVCAEASTRRWCRRECSDRTTSRTRNSSSRTHTGAVRV